MEEKGKIAFTNDIIKEAAKELGIDEKVVYYLYHAVIDYMQYLVLKTPCTAIFIPNLGTFYIRHSFVQSKLRKLKVRSRKYFEELLVFEGKYLRLKKYLSQYKNFRERKKSRHLQKFKHETYFYTQGMSFEEIETLQNEEKE